LQVLQVQLVDRMRIQSLHVYPVKGCRGIALAEAELLASGLRHDRRFMVLGADDTFVTQREHPSMARVDVAIAADRLLLSVDGGPQASAPLVPEGLRRRVRVWSDEVEAVDVGGDGAALFSAHLGMRCSLVFMPADVVRPVERPYGRPGDRVGFADAYPVLLASLASLADLNARLAEAGAPPVPMNRFRPTIVVEGGAPFAEDSASLARLGPVVLRLPKPCGRCKVTTVDQRTGATGQEPLRTLARYRTTLNQVNFAVNAIPDLAPSASAVLRVGDPVAYEDALT
jgi:uncharacterized protein YcbX